MTHTHRFLHSNGWPCLALLLMTSLQGCDSGAPTRGADTPDDPPTNDPPAGTITGLDARPANATCAAWPRPNAGGNISLRPFTSLSFTQPLGLLQAPGNSSRWFVVQQGGVIKQFDGANPTGVSDFIDLAARVTVSGRNSETGLLGMAFHPDFPTDNRVFLSYTTRGALASRISAFRSNDGGVTLDPASESVLLTIDQPESNHNGGHIAFGPDGYLYIGIGDGGGGGDNHGNPGNGQRLTTLLGKLLRIDVDGAPPYEIPPTNPYAANASCPAAGRASGECPEIYAYGLRNPWRWNFDRANGDLWLGDVGQGQWEEVDKVTAGGNYGWRCREGAHDFNSGGTTGCNAGGLIDPVTEYSHSLGISITGGYVYRGAQNTTLTGRYLFGDFGSGRIWAWIPENGPGPTQLLDSPLQISSFGQGNDGELYVVDYGAGGLHRVVFESATGSDVTPTTLSATGCVNPSNASQPASGLLPYAVNAPFWSDGADKERWMALPDGQNIAVRADGDWSFPMGTVLVKNFRIASRLIETRLFVRHPDGVWGGFSYEWNAAQTDAALVRGGAVRDIGGGQRWIFPSESQCLDCHTEAAGRALGLETAQLNRSFAYAQTGRTANELTTLNHIGMLAPPITDAASQATLPDPFGSASLGERARAYLHTNCSQCHRPDGPTPSNMDLRYTTPLAATNACNAMPSTGQLDLGADARLIAPGSAANSVTVNRMNRRDFAAMPPVGSNLVDAAGVTLLSQWIEGLRDCQ